MVDGSALFTLHGHCGPITSVFMDGGSLEALGSEGEVAVDLGVGAIIGSGSQDGMLCVWDVGTGACVYRWVVLQEGLCYCFGIWFRIHKES